MNISFVTTIINLPTFLEDIAKNVHSYFHENDVSYILDFFKE